ncbi:ABC transporter ATP-binding protein [Nocardia nova]|uniref:ABC transporter ATP-binding protein n=1 Tax=Nocardia nova TaxID=37330 RepID=UPI0033CBA941
MTDMAAAPQRWELMETLRGAQSGRTALVTAIVGGVLQYGGAVVAGAAGGWLAGAAALGRSADRLGPGLTVLVIAVILATVGSWMNIQYAHAFAFRHQATTRLRVFDGMERSAPRELQGRRTGDLAAVAMGDVETLETFFAHLAPPAVANAVVAVAVLIGLAVVHPIFAVIMLIATVLTLALPLLLSRWASAGGQRLRSELGALNADVVDGVGGLRELVLFGQVESFQRRLADRAGRYRTEQLAHGRILGFQSAATDFVMAVAKVSALVAAAVLVSDDRIGLAWAVAAIALIFAALSTVAEIGGVAGMLAPLRASARRVTEIVSQPAQIADTAVAAPEIAAPPALRFDTVTFGYLPGRPVLEAVDFEVPAGSTVAVVGRSGAGKSTCVNLLLRFWDPDRGAIRIDGHDLREFPLQRLREVITIVPQDIYLFTGTVADNLRLGRPEATDDDLVAAATAANAHDFIADLPDGYDTQVGERGAHLSGGQRQRLAIARALVTGAPVLIMDEAASNLDSENERAIHTALRTARRGHTTLIVAHRLSTIRSADLIVVLDGGSVVETGTHEKLSALPGSHYARLLATQFRDPVEVAE